MISLMTESTRVDGVVILVHGAVSELCEVRRT